MGTLEKGNIINFDMKKKFKYIDALGQGGTGKALLFKDETTDMLFAIKKYETEDKEHEEESTRYYGEILKKGYVYFRSYEKASTWSKINNGETFIACGAGYRSKEKLKDSKKYNFFEVKDEEIPHFYCSIITNSKKTTY